MKVLHALFTIASLAAAASVVAAEPEAQVAGTTAKKDNLSDAARHRRHHVHAVERANPTVTAVVGRRPITSKATTKATAGVTRSRTSTSTALSAPTTIPAVNKKGVSYNDKNTKNVDLYGNSIGWTYNWFSEPEGTFSGTSKVAYYPMMWGTKDPWLTSIWSANAKKAIANGATHLLGFNEPDLGDQAAMTVAQAVTAWRTYMEPFAGQAKLVAPAITNGGAPAGVQYMKDFLAACTGCHIDAVAMHWYDQAWNVGYFKNYFTDAMTTFKKPIWITEFAGSGTAAERITFIKTVVPWLNAQAGIERYAIFGNFEGSAASGNLITNGVLNDVGKAYKAAA